ncbi:hypothetical protein PybrP1_004510, partial [[Pythium] brassicae (nom. inval.)]
MYMKDRRWKEKLLSTAGMMEFIMKHHSQWLTAHVDGKESREVAYASLQRFLPHFCTLHGFLQSTYSDVNIYKHREAGINYDIPPTR